VDDVLQMDYNKINCRLCRADGKLQNKGAKTHFFKIASGGCVTWRDIYGNSGEQEIQEFGSFEVPFCKRKNIRGY
jgi:hypothetical protein